MMLDVARITRGRHAVASPSASEAGVPALRAWADVLAMLARSHRARLAASDASRPWLSAGPLAPRHERR